MGLKLIKWIAIGIPVLVFLSSLSLYFVVQNIGTENLRNLLQKEVKQATGLSVQMNGDVTIEAGFLPRLDITDMLLSNAPWSSDPVMMRAQQLSTRLDLLSLLKGQVLFKEIAMDQVFLRLESDQQGRNNWNLETQTNDPPSFDGANLSYADQIRSGIASLVAITRHFDRVSINDLKVDYFVDNTLKRSYAIAWAGLEAENQDERLNLNLTGAENKSGQALHVTIDGAGKFLEAEDSLGVTLAVDAKFWEAQLSGLLRPQENRIMLDLQAGLKGADLEKMHLDLDEFFDMPSWPERADKLAFDAQALIVGDLESPSLKKVELSLENDMETSVMFKGSLEDFLNKAIMSATFDMTVTKPFHYLGTVPELAHVPWDDLPPSALGPLSMSGSIKGPLSAPVIFDAQAMWNRKDDFQIVLQQTKVGFSPLTFATRLSFKVKDTPLIRSVTKAFLPDQASSMEDVPLGQVMANGEVSLDETGQLKITQAEIELGRPKRAYVKASNINGHFDPNDFDRSSFDFNWLLEGDNLVGHTDYILDFGGPDVSFPDQDSLQGQSESIDYRAEGHLRLEGGAASLTNASFVMADSYFKATASVSDLFARPSVKAALSNMTIKWSDIEKIFDGDAPPSKEVFSREPLKLSSLRDFDLDFKAEGKLEGKAGSLFERVWLDLSLKNGTASLNRFRGQTLDGLLDLSGQWALSDAALPTLDLSMNVKDISLGQLLSRMDIADWLRGGPANGTLKGSMQGTSPHAMAKSFNGTIVLGLGPGKLDETLIDWLGGDLLTNVYTQINPFSQTLPYSELECGEVFLVFENGKAAFENRIALETKRVALLAGGTIDLGAETLDLSLASTHKQGLGISIGGTGTLTRLTGPLNNPSIRLDAIGAAKRGLSVGASILTGGLSTLLETVYNSLMRDAKACQRVLNSQAK